MGEPLQSGRFRQLPAAIVAMFVSRQPRALPQNRRMAKSAVSARAGFFNDNGSGLLIVPALFFIHRRYGEVAEWSKALPC
ncbi:hypothetical protein [Mesorhizobium sp. L-2-11]|uniref:hypothetical protein n=1 Tax=Mesorhizobium sp. L-2-11 TaxID=2744521 RepID=UPI001224FE0A|nr:hypothetical protein [Mesorhizobium sp. L-2-11]TIQ17298.1 MAG: hypothetical protein E5X51_31390 [Mesorhizobium sp.]